MAAILMNIGYAAFIVISSILLWYISVIIHEIGHLIAAIANGERFLSLSAGYIRIYKSNKGIEFSLLKSYDAICQTVPSKDVIVDSKRLNAVTKRAILGGITANIIFDLLMYAVIFAFFKESQFLPVILAPTLSPLILTMYSFKLKFDGGCSDILVYSMLQNEIKKEVMEAYLRIQYSVLDVNCFEELEKGIGIKNININDIDILLNCGDVRFEYLGFQCAYEYYAKMGDMLRAKEMRQRQTLLYDEVDEEVRDCLMIKE